MKDEAKDEAKDETMEEAKEEEVVVEETSPAKVEATKAKAAPKKKK